MKLIPKFFLFVILASQVASLYVNTMPAYADTAMERPRIKPERGDHKEYYYFDGTTVHGKGGQYADEVTFTLYEDFHTIYATEDKSIKINPAVARASNEQCGSDTIPTRLWDPYENKATDHPAVYFNLTASGGAELDLKDDSEDGVFRWGKVRKELHERHETIPDDISGATLAKDHTNFAPTKAERARILASIPLQNGETIVSGLKAHTSAVVESVDAESGFWKNVGNALIAGNVETFNTVTDLGKNTITGFQKSFTVSLQDDDIECVFYTYNHLNRLLSPYDDTTTALAPLGGYILGIYGMPFEEYVVRADNRLMYYAYTQAARNQTTDHCNAIPNSHKCIVDIDTAVRACYAEAAGSSNLFKPDGDLSKEAEWDKPLEQDKFVSCLEEKTELIDDGYFRNDEHLKQFIELVIMSIVPPPSINPEDPDPIIGMGEDGAPAPSDTQCSLGMLGWILCPVFNFIATINDMVFSILRHWLVLAPFQQNPGGENSAAYSTWQQARNIVNALFVVFFLVIIFAQVTGRGMQTYGLRALAPRIIVGALLVNLSYIICGIAVDISNAAGDSIYRTLNDTAVEGAQIGTGAFDGGWQNVTASITLLGGAAAGTFILLGNLAALVPVMVMAFIALVTTFLLLLLRQALIIIFVAFAPFAFILYILPNTKPWFDKWRTIFINLLMLYPVFAVIFAGSQLAAQVVRDSAAQDGNEIMAIFSLGIQVIPLFLLPLIMKLGGGILNRFGGIINNPNKGPFDKAKNRAEEFRKDRKTQQQIRALSGRKGALGYGAFIRANQRTQMKQARHKRNATRAKQNYLPGQQQKIAKMAGGPLAGKALTSDILDNIRTTAIKEALEEYEAAKALIEHNIDEYDDNTLLDQALKRQQYGGVDDAEQAAGVDMVIQGRDIGMIEDMLDNLYDETKGLTELQEHVILKAVQASGVGASAAHLSADNIKKTIDAGDPRDGTGFVDRLYQTASTESGSGGFTQNAMATQDAATIHGLDKRIRSGVIDAQNGAAIVRNFDAAAADTKKLRTYMSASTLRAGQRFKR